MRVKAILSQLEPSGLVHRIPVKEYPLRHITAVHESEYVFYLKRACEGVPPGQSVYPYVFPVRNRARPPKELPLRAGYYCIDTFTPLNQNAFIAAKRAVDCTLTAADDIMVNNSITSSVGDLNMVFNAAKIAPTAMIPPTTYAITEMMVLMVLDCCR